jgi:hypothetical protein
MVERLVTSDIKFDSPIQQTKQPASAGCPRVSGSPVLVDVFPVFPFQQIREHEKHQQEQQDINTDVMRLSF